MIKKEKINGIVFKEETTFRIEKDGKLILKTSDEDEFYEAKEKAIDDEKPEDINKENESAAMNKIAKVLDEKIISEMNGNISLLARKSGVTTVTLANLRKGEGNPNLNSLVRIFTALDVELSEVFK